MSLQERKTGNQNDPPFKVFKDQAQTSKICGQSFVQIVLCKLFFALFNWATPLLSCYTYALADAATAHTCAWCFVSLKRWSICVHKDVYKFLTSAVSVGVPHCNDFACK